jgi:lysophospholipase
MSFKPVARLVSTCAPSVAPLPCDVERTARRDVTAVMPLQGVGTRRGAPSASRWRLTRVVLPQLLVAVALFTAGAARAGDAPPPFAPLAGSAETTAAWPISNEARFAGQDWRAIEAATMTMADRQIGRLAGVPNGRDGSAVWLHRRWYVHRQETRGGIVLVPGFTEGATLYQEVIHDLVANGWSVYIHDHRGQGFSTRLLPQADGRHRDKGHLDDFHHLVDDLERHLAEVIAARAGRPGPLTVMAHSMGGAVVSLHLARTGRSTPFTAAVLVTPMHEPRVAPAGERPWLRRWCADWVTPAPTDWPLLSARAARGRPYATERAAFDAQPDASHDELTHSLERLRRHWDARGARCEGGAAEACGHIDAAVTMPTLRWVAESCAASRESRGPSAGRIAVPVLLQGGEDTVVENAAQQVFCANVNAGRTPGGRCIGRRIDGARHAVLIESDPMRKPALVAAFDFLASGGGSEPGRPGDR